MTAKLDTACPSWNCDRGLRDFRVHWVDHDRHLRDGTLNLLSVLGRINVGIDRHDPELPPGSSEPAILIPRFLNALKSRDGDLK